jgi:hypothetical protein
VVVSNSRVSLQRAGAGIDTGNAGEVGPADARHVDELRGQLHGVAAPAGLRGGDMIWLPDPLNGS